MTPAARLSAAIEILDAWHAAGTPIDVVLRRWGQAHRFAGSKDRAAIAERVYAVLKRRSRLAWRMAGESGRALVLGSLCDIDGLSPDEIDACLKSGGSHAPSPLSSSERERLLMPLDDAPAWVIGCYPEWLHDDLARGLGASLAREAKAWFTRGPTDLRANLLKTSREDARTALLASGYVVALTPLSPIGLRIPAGRSVTSSTPYAEGLVEVQDEGSQLAVLAAGAAPGMTVCELGAGAGGKSLALAAAMGNRGRIVAADTDRARLERMEPRLARAGVSIVEPRVMEDASALGDLEGVCDLVFVDAPCSGSGTWRREPENKWRLTPQVLETHLRTQALLLRQGAELVRPGGRMVYVTCSLLPQENDDQLAKFLTQDRRFERAQTGDCESPTGTVPLQDGVLRLTPGTTGTDGFFAAVLHKNRPVRGG